MSTRQWSTVPQDRTRRGLWSLAALLLMMSSLVLAAPSADASAGGPECAEGELIGDQCRIEVGPPSTGEPTCPVSDTVIQDGDECYTLVVPVTECAAGTIADGSACRQPVVLVPGSLTCADGFGLIDGGCFRTVESVIVESCVDGTLEGGVCVIEGAPPIAGPATCPVSDGVFLDGNECYELVPTVPGACPTGTTDDPSGECREPVATLPGALTCADGFGLLDGECVRFEEGEFVMICELGEPLGELCIQEGPEPVQGPPTCPVSEVVFEDVDGCYRIVSPEITGDVCVEPYILIEDGRCRTNNTGDDAISLVEFSCPNAPEPITEVIAFLGDIAYIESCFYVPVATPTCPPGTTPLTETECRLPVDRVPGEFSCPDEYDFLDNRCLIVTIPATVLVCVEGVPSGSTCVVLGDPPVQGPDVCPVSDAVLQDGDECYMLVSRSNVCPDGTTVDPSGDCRQPVPLVAGELVCDDGYTLDATALRCLQVVDPVATPTCVEGQITGDLLQCIIEGEPPVAGPSVCPVSDTVLQDGDQCYTLVPAQTVCPAGAILDEATELCREPVDLVPGSGGCAGSETLIDNVCVIFVDPVYFCAGVEVTINMLLGDDGRGTSNDDVILGTNGADLIRGRGGNDIICGGGGDDDIRAGNGNDAVFGGGGNDIIRGNNGDDMVEGGGGNDDLRGDSGNDVVFGGAGDDRLRGGSGNDVLRGGQGNDDIAGGGGNDELYGGAGDDECRGNGGNDVAGANCEVVNSAG